MAYEEVMNEEELLQEALRLSMMQDDNQPPATKTEENKENANQAQA